MDRHLHDRWTGLIAPLGVGEAQSTAVLEDLCRRYDEPHRAYHTLAHLRHVLEVVDFLRAREPVADPIAVELAAWFHDAVCEGQDGDERRSAALAAEVLLSWGLTDEAVARVVDLILTTQDHRPESSDAAVLADADLAVLASSPDVYAVYRRGVRVEYRHLDDAAWRAGREAFLVAMLARDGIFTTPTMRARGEAAARRNLTAELGELRAG